MTVADLSFRAPPTLAIAAGATTPNPGVAGAVVWSSTTSSLLAWTGSAWQPIGSGAITKTRVVVDFGNGSTDKQFDVAVPNATVGCAVFAQISADPVAIASYVGREIVQAGVGAQGSISGLSPAPEAIAGGATYLRVTNTQRLAGGGLSHVATGWSWWSINAGANATAHRGTFTTLSGCKQCLVNFAGASEFNEPAGSGPNATGYTVDINRVDTASAWNAVLLRNVGNGASSVTLATAGSTFPSSVTQFVVDVSTVGGVVSGVITPTGGGSVTTLSATDSTYRGSYVGAEANTSSAPYPTQQFEFGRSVETLSDDESVAEPFVVSGRCISAGSVRLFCNPTSPRGVLHGRRYIDILIG